LPSVANAQISGRSCSRRGISWIFLRNVGHDKKAAKTYYRELRRGSAYTLPVIVTEKLRSHGAAIHEMLTGCGTSAASLSQQSGAKFLSTNTAGQNNPWQRGEELRLMYTIVRTCVKKNA
jgi:hypothetical protein